MDYNKALQKCMNICSRNEYCRFDLHQKFKKWEVSSFDANKIIEYLEDNKYLDEERYATAFVNDKFKFNHWGKIKIAYYLKHKNISSVIVKNALDKISFAEYEKICKNEIEKKRPKVNAESNYERNGKTAQYVISKGFESDLVFKLLNSNFNN